MPITRFMCDEIAVSVFLEADNVRRQGSWAAPVIAKARVEEITKTTRSADGTTIPLSTWFATTQPVGALDRVWIAPFIGNNSPRKFPPGFVYVDADARSPVLIENVRKMRGNDGHFEVSF